MTTINSVGNGLSGATGSGAFVGATAPTLSTPFANNFIAGFQSIATAAGTTTLTSASTYQTQFTGVTTQTLAMPDVTTLSSAGYMYLITNLSTGNVTVQSSGGNTIQVMASNSTLYLTNNAITGATAASWTPLYIVDVDISGAVLLSPAGDQTILNSHQLISSGLIVGQLGLTANGGAINISTDTGTSVVNIGTGAAARALTIGTTTASATVTLNAPTGGVTITGLFGNTVASSQFVTVNAAGLIGSVSEGGFASTFNADSGTATPAAGAITITGGTTGLTTTGATNVITLTGTLKIANGGTQVTSVTVAPTATAFAGWDANKNLSAVSFIEGYTTTATAGGTTTLVVGSTEQQFFTGTLNQTVVLPVTSTLANVATNAQKYIIVNTSSGVLTINSSGGNLVQSLPAASQCTVTCILNSGTTAASWYSSFGASGGSGTVNAGTINQVAWYAATGNAVSGLATANNGLLVTSAGGVPSIGNTIGADITVHSLTVGRGAGAFSTNSVFGNSAFANNASGTNSVIIGNQAAGSTTNGLQSVVIGSGAALLSSTMSQNVLIGYDVATNINAVGSNNVGIGYETMQGAAGSTFSFCTGLGNISLTNLTTGTYITAVGANSLPFVNTGGFNTACGALTGTATAAGSLSLTTGTNNTFLGYAASANNIACIGAIAIGANAVGTISTGSYSAGIAIGSASFPVGFNSANVPVSPSAANTAGYWRPKLNGVNFLMPLFIDAVTTTSATMLTDLNGAPILSSAMTNGQIIIGSTGATPLTGNITSTGNTLTITNGAGTINIETAAGSGIVWAANASSSFTAAVGNGYILTSGSATTVTLPTTFAVGTMIGIQGEGAAWTIDIGAATNVKVFGNTYTTSIASANNPDSIVLIATVANTTWSVLSMVTTGFTAS